MAENKHICKYCGCNFIRLDLHEPSCKSKSEKAGNNLVGANISHNSNDDEGENKRNNVCSYCGCNFIRLDLHEPSCKLKSEKAGNDLVGANYSHDSNDDEGGEKKRNNVCSYCGCNFIRLDLHEPSCKLKSEKAGNDLEGANYLHDSNDDEGEKKRNNVCSYCGCNFIRLDLHEPSCKSKSEKAGNDLAGANYSHNSNDDEGENKRNNVCSYCGCNFIRLDLHEPSCKSKSEKAGNNLVGANYSHNSNDDEGENKRNNVCSYCGCNFIRLDLHEPSCKLKSEKAGNDLEGANYLHNSNDDEGENKRNNVCSYCRCNFSRLDLHEPSCKLKLEPQNHDFDFQEPESVLKPEQVDPVGSEADILTFNEFYKSVQIKHSDITCAASVINDLMGNIFYKVNSLLPLKWEKFNSGSYYSHVKVLKPNEFDYMLYPTLVRCRIEPCAEDLCFCRAFVTNKDDLPYDFQKILTPQNELTPSQFKKYTFQVFEKLAYKKNLTIIENKVTCPAFTVKYQYESYGKKEADIDWVPSLLVQEVPKIYKAWESRKISIEDKENGLIFVVPKMKIVDGKEMEVWRLSYSFFEKEIIGRKCTTDERTIVRILKKIREEVKDENSVLCSYHIVTSCLHFFHTVREKPKVKEYTIDVMGSLIKQLEERNLPHFFISTFNLLADVDEEECQKFIQRLKYYKQKFLTPFTQNCE